MKGNISLKNHIGTFYVIDERIIDGRKLYLLESEIYGDEAACVITDDNFNVLEDNIYNGLDEYIERREN
jgi:hypothetical protein